MKGGKVLKEVEKVSIELYLLYYYITLLLTTILLYYLLLYYFNTYHYITLILTTILLSPQPSLRDVFHQERAFSISYNRSFAVFRYSSE